MRYKVVFRGKIDENLSLDDILENVAELFDQSPEEVYQELFEQPQKAYVFIQGLSSKDAKEYQEALLEAGIITDLDLDLDLENFEEKELITKKMQAAMQRQEDSGIDTLQIDTEILEKINASQMADDKSTVDKSFRFEPEEFTLVKDEATIEASENNRISRLKSTAKRRREVVVEIDNEDKNTMPPLFQSGVRIGRMLFIHRIILGLAALFVSLNILPIYLFDTFGTSGYYVSLIIILIVSLFILMVISQRFCDFDNMTVAKMLCIVTVLAILVFSVFVHHYFILLDASITFADQFLAANSHNPNYQMLENSLEHFISTQNAEILFTRFDTLIMWAVYASTFLGASLLLFLPGEKGNNEYGASPPKPNAVSASMFIVGLVLLIFAFTYPYSSKEHRYENRLYKTEFYEHIGMLKPLPSEFNQAYKEYLKKNSTKSL